MLVIGTFEHSLELEQALAVIENNDISQEKIMVVCMDLNPGNSQLLIAKSQDFINKCIEVGMASATAIAVAGTSIGFILTWGPIFWGLAFGFIGFCLGFIVYFFIKKDNYRHVPKKLPEIVVIVQCFEEQSIFVSQTMWKFKALTVGKFQTASN
jgi:hypothetical protein